MGLAGGKKCCLGEAAALPSRCCGSRSGGLGEKGSLLAPVTWRAVAALRCCSAGIGGVLSAAGVGIELLCAAVSGQSREKSGKNQMRANEM